MPESPQLELMWTSRAEGREPEPLLPFGVVDDAANTRTEYVAVFRVCPTARCGCHSVFVHCKQVVPAAASPPLPPRSFWLDLRARTPQLGPELKADPAALSLAKLVTAGLGEAAWEELHRWFWTAKIQAIETADLDEVELNDLPNADDGHMISFVEVFPLGLSLNFTHEDAAWAADELYCVQPDCKCKEIVLSFLKLKDADGRVAKELRDAPAVWYECGTQATRPLAAGPPGTPPTAQLLDALKQAHPGLDRRLKLHQDMMRSLYSRHYHARRARESDPAQRQAVTREPKVGRNEPCPCGSGKKYKRCCGSGA